MDIENFYRLSALIARYQIQSSMTKVGHMWLRLFAWSNFGKMAVDYIAHKMNYSALSKGIVLEHAAYGNDPLSTTISRR